MTKEHFIALADAIRDFNNAMPNEDRTRFTTAQTCALADFCADASARFDRERWLGYIAGTNGKNGANND